jgi:hypothetical protein
MRTAIPLTLLATTLACSLASVPAQARARVFVASYGSDSNPCTFLSPCRNFQQAVNVVDAGGEVTAIDSAGFGPINITKAVTITSPDGVEAGIVPAAAGEDAIDINAVEGGDIVLRGLTLNGGGLGGNGIVFNAGFSLTVTNCVVQNFRFVTPGTGSGILIQSGGSYAITNTTVVNNNDGIVYAGANGVGVIDHVVATSNNCGISVGPFSGSSTVTISNSNVSNNRNDGISGGTTSFLTVSIDNVTASGNGIGNNGWGIAFSNNTNVLLGRSVITGNQGGIQNATSPNAFYTYGNNQINLNAGGNDISFAPLLTTFTPR